MTFSINRRVALATAAFAAATIGIKPAQAQAKKKQIKISTATAADLGNDNYMVCWTMANYINQFSDTLEARIYAANALGEERSVVEAMQLGSGASAHVGGTAIHNNFNKRIGVLDLPFMWRDYDHFHKVAEGPVGKMLTEEHEKLGLKIIGWQDSWGFRHVTTTKKEVKSAADLKGLKIRTIQTPTYVAALNAMGAAATPMAFGEVYTGLQTGVLDGFEHSSAIIYSNKFYEVSKYIALTGHLFGGTITAYSKKEWDGYTDAERKVVGEAAKLGQDINRALSVVRDQESLELLKGKGMVINKIDTAPFVAAAGPVQDELAEKLGAKDLLKIIRETK
jgi:TRAP-type transport system periplasmic protein